MAASQINARHLDTSLSTDSCRQLVQVGTLDRKKATPRVVPLLVMLFTLGEEGVLDRSFAPVRVMIMLVMLLAMSEEGCKVMQSMCSSSDSLCQGHLPIESSTTHSTAVSGDDQRWTAPSTLRHWRATLHLDS